MKKIFTLFALFMLTLGLGAQTLLPNTDNQEYSSIGANITTLDELKSGYYVLSNYGIAKNNGSTAHAYINENSSNQYEYCSAEELSNSAVVYITVDENATTNSTKSVTIQAYNGGWWQQLSDGVRISLGKESSAATFTVSVADASQQDFYFLNNSCYINDNAGAAGTYVIGRNTGKKGDWARTILYPVTLKDAEPQTWKLTAYGQPEGVTYTFDGQTITPGSKGVSLTGTKDVSDLVVSETTGYTTNVEVNNTKHTVTVTFLRTAELSETVTGKIATFGSDAATSLTDGSWYLIKNSRDGTARYAYYTENHNNTPSYGSKGFFLNTTDNFESGVTVSDDNKVYLFQAHKTNDGYYYFQNANGIYLAELHNNSTGNQTQQGGTSGYPYKMTEPNADKYPTYFALQSLPNEVVLMCNGGSNLNLVGWGTAIPESNNTSATGNNVWQFYEVTLADPAGFEVTLNINGTDGTLIKSETTTTATAGANATFTLPTAAYTTYSSDDDNVSIENGVAAVSNVNAATTVNIIATFSTPFESSTDYASAKWYYLQNANENVYVYYDASHQYTPYGNFDSNNRDNYKWAFIGNPIEGYQVINKGAGKGKFLYIARADNNASTSPVMSDTQQSPAWILKEGTTDGSYGTGKHFSMKKVEGTTTYSWNKRTYLGFWDGYDGGSNWYATDASAIDLTAYNAALEKAKKSYKFGTGLNEYSGDGSAITNAISTYGSYSENNTQDEVDAATTAINNAISNLTLNLPETGTYLRLKGSASNAYLTANATASTDAMQAKTEVTDATIWYYGEDGLLSYTAGQYLGTQKALSATAEGVSIVENPNFVGTYGVRTGNNRYIYSVTANADIDRGNIDNIASNSQQGYAWTLEQVTELPVKMNKAGNNKYYATVCLPVAVTVPSGTKAYAVKNVSGTFATLADMGSVIPAKAGALLINEEGTNVIGDETNGYYINLTVGGTATYKGNNKLTGAYKAEQVATTTDSENNTITANYYFGQLNKTPGFYIGKGSFVSGKYITNRAYLTASIAEGTNESKGFTFVFGDDDPTGISSATATDEILENSVRYNLQGQRVDAGYKGIVIIGGKKYLIK